MFEIVRNAVRQPDILAELFLSLGGLLAILLLILLFVLFRLRQTGKRLTALTRGQEGNLEQILAGHMEVVAETIRRMEALEQSVGVLQAQMPGCLQKVQLGRYDAFEDVGGEQSFSLTLLNARGDGFVLTSVYSRSDVRVYAKSIQNGQSSHPLSKEEQQILRASLSS